MRWLRRMESTLGHLALHRTCNLVSKSILRREKYAPSFVWEQRIGELTHGQEVLAGLRGVALFESDSQAETMPSFFNCCDYMMTNASSTLRNWRDDAILIGVSRDRQGIDLYLIKAELYDKRALHVNSSDERRMTELCITTQDRRWMHIVFMLLLLLMEE